jgi:UDP-N-acetylmuramate--alanine ligase
MDFDGNVSGTRAGEMVVEYRGCDALKNHIALGAVFKGRADSPEIAQRMSAFSEKRWASQPAAPSAGCAFKNPPSIPAGKLIDELGMKGARVGRRGGVRRAWQFHRERRQGDGARRFGIDFNFAGEGEGRARN